jgi:hypothetical protein
MSNSNDSRFTKGELKAQILPYSVEIITGDGIDFKRFARLSMYDHENDITDRVVVLANAREMLNRWNCHEELVSVVQAVVTWQESIGHWTMPEVDAQKLRQALTYLKGPTEVSQEDALAECIRLGADLDFIAKEVA